MNEWRKENEPNWLLSTFPGQRLEPRKGGLLLETPVNPFVNLPFQMGTQS